MTSRTCRALVGTLVLLLAGHSGFAQAGNDALSQREVDDLRDAAFVPMERLKVFTEILNNREKRVEDLLAKRRSHTDFPEDMHDVLD